MTQDEHAQAIVTAGDRLAEAVEREMALTDEWPLVKLDAIDRLMKTSTQLSGKPHSLTSAESVVETDAAAMAHKVAIRTATRDKIKAKAYYEACRVRALVAA